MGTKPLPYQQAKGRKNPCHSSPKAPENVRMTFKVEEARTHLRFTGRIRWDEVEEDQDGFPANIQKYGITWVACDVNGDPVDDEEDPILLATKTRFHARRKDPVAHVGIKEATAAGGIATFTTAREHGWITGDKVKVTGMEPDAYNGTWTVIDSTNTTFTANIGASPADATDFGKAEDADDTLHIITKTLPRPKTWYWKARVRAQNAQGCWGPWSPWTDPKLPWEEGDPKPPVPDDIDLDFDHKGRKRFSKLRAIATCDEVVDWDVPGGDRESDMDRYLFQLWFSEDDGSTWELHGHRGRDAKDEDEDPNLKVKAIFHRIHKKYKYRLRVRTKDRFNRKGDWSAWIPDDDGMYPDDVDTPLPPANPTLDVDQHIIRFKWDAPDETADPDAIHDSVAYFQWQIASDANFTYFTTGGSNEAIRHGRTLNERTHVKVKRPGTGSYYARVRSVDEEHDKSSTWALAPTTSATKNTPTTPQAPGVTFDTKGTRNARYRALVAVTAVSPTDHEISKYVVQLAHDASGGASPPGGAKRQHGRVEGDATGDDLTEVFRNIPRKHYVWARVRAVDTEGKRSAFSGWMSAGRPMDSGASDRPDAPTGVDVANPSPRRFVVTWSDPTDDEAVRWRVQIVNQNGVKETGYTRTNRYVYRSSKAERRLTHTANVYAINDLGLESMSPGQDNTAGMDDDVAAEEIGSIKLWGHGAMPTGWWRCNGDAKSTTGEGAALFAVILYNFGGSGSTFYLPDYRKRAVRGVGDSGGTGSEAAYLLADTDGLAEASRVEYAGQHQAHGINESNKEFDHKHGSGTLSIPSGTTSSGNVVESIPTGGNRDASGYQHGHIANAFTGLTGRAKPPDDGPEFVGSHKHDVAISGVVDQSGASIGHGHKKKAYGRAHYIIKYA